MCRHAWILKVGIKQITLVRQNGKDLILERNSLKPNDQFKVKMILIGFEGLWETRYSMVIIWNLFKRKWRFFVLKLTAVGLVSSGFVCTISLKFLAELTWGSLRSAFQQLRLAVCPSWSAYCVDQQHGGPVDVERRLPRFRHPKMMQETRMERCHSLRIWKR